MGSRFATPLLFAKENHRIDSVQWFDGVAIFSPPLALNYAKPDTRFRDVVYGVTFRYPILLAAFP